MKDRQSIILEKCRKFLSFSNPAKDVQDRIKKVNQPSFFEHEKQKVNEIRNLIDSGGHEQALRQVLKDFAHEDGIRYFNRIRYLENNSESPSGETLDVKPSNNKADLECSHCCWEGFNSSHKPLHCTNARMKHPWKTSINAFNVEEPVQSNQCAYHQKFCTDELRRHPQKAVKISVPNKHALCTECFILKEGRKPETLLRRVPGVKRMISSPVTNVRRVSRHGSTKRKDSLLLSNDAGKEDDEEDYLKKVLAAKKIQFQWRIKKTKKEKEIHDYEQHLILNDAALKLQDWFCRLPKVEKKTKAILQSKERSVLSKKVPHELHCKVIEHGELCDKFNNDDLVNDIMNLSYSISLAQHQSMIDKSRNSRKHKSKKLSTDIAPKKCKLQFCQLCSDKPMQSLKRRKVDLIPIFHDRETVAYRMMVLTDATRFEAEDPFGNRIIQKAKFESLLTQMYDEIGHPLPVQELESIVNTFSCRDGFVDYEEYLNHARQQGMPCSIHGRFVCTDTRCVHKFYEGEKRTKCTRFTPSRPNSNFCKCGEYISRHKIKPKQKIMPMTKRGLSIFSSDDMKRTFARQTKPDINAAVYFNSIASCFKDKVPYDDKFRRKKQIDNKAKSNRFILTQKATNSENYQKHVITENSTICSSEAVDETETVMVKEEELGQGVYTSFSPAKLSTMLKECIKYRIPSVQKKPTVSCPLCQRTFFNHIMLNKHIIQRHTKKEVESYMNLHHHEKEEEGQEDEEGGNISSKKNIEVHWIGKHITCPPFKSVIPIDICYNHTPPHPKCLKCNESLEKLPMFPPMRFYPSAYFQYEISSSLSDDSISTYNSSWDTHTTTVKKQFHFNTSDVECCIILKNRTIGKIEALCEDNFKRGFIGYKCFLSYEHFKEFITSRTAFVKQGLSFQNYCDTNGIELNTNDELILLSSSDEVEWTEMTNVVERIYVFFCNEYDFLQRKINMGLSIVDDNDDSSRTFPAVKFCHLQWSGDKLEKCA